MENHFDDTCMALIRVLSQRGSNIPTISGTSPMGWHAGGSWGGEDIRKVRYSSTISIQPYMPESHQEFCVVMGDRIEVSGTHWYWS